MEIQKAVMESGDRRLQAKYKQSIYVIERTLSLYSFDDVALSFNGGKDSTVLLHLLRAGYALVEAREDGGNEPVWSKPKHPIRTIYFESHGAFPEINAFTYTTAKAYDLQMEIIRLDFKSGLEALIKVKPVQAIFLGTRIGDPNAVGQEQFSPSSAGWPPFMRVNPILDWSYRDVWAFLLACKVPYCKLYDQGYTSIGSIHDTVPNGLLCVENPSGDKEKFRPAYLLADGRLERAGRMKRASFKIRDSTLALSNGTNDVPCDNSTLAASIIGIGEGIL
uniref:FAD synthase n=1 Tax=Araucaria cunninghamii TaxID=56994 RepID=A0A0D6R103_ARACU